MTKIEQMTDDELATLLRDVLVRVDKSSIPEAKAEAARLKELGVQRNVHVGAPKPFTHRMNLEWYAGQFLDLVESEAWWAMNSFLNRGVP